MNQSQWINCSYRLPRKYKTVLVIFFDVDPSKNVFSSSCKIWSFRNWRGKWQENFYSLTVDINKGLIPYCWQPLPKAPK